VAQPVSGKGELPNLGDDGEGDEGGDPGVKARPDSLHFRTMEDPGCGAGALVDTNGN